MQDEPNETLEATIARALGISEDELSSRSPADVFRELNALAEQRQNEYEQAQGRINKRLAKTRLTQIQTACEASRSWAIRGELAQILDKAMDLADQGSHFRASDLLANKETEFKALEDSPLKSRYQNVLHTIQATLRPEKTSENLQPVSNPSSFAHETPQTEQPQEHKEPAQETTLRSPSPQAIETPSVSETTLETKTASRFTYDLGKKGRLHICSPDKPLTFGRYGTPHKPDFGLIAAIPKDKSATSRLLQMISGKHGSIIHSSGQWGILDSWPSQEKKSTNGIFIEGVKLEAPASFRRLHGKHLTFATADRNMPLPCFRIHVLDTNKLGSPESILLERLDFFKDHILLLSESATLPSSLGSLTISRHNGGFTQGTEQTPIKANTPNVLAFDYLQVSPLEPVFYDREI